MRATPHQPIGWGPRSVMPKDVMTIPTWARSTFTPEAVAIYFAHSGVILSADSCRAISALLTTIQKGGTNGPKA